MKPSGKVQDFIVGFFAFLIVNAVVYSIATIPSPQASEPGSTQELVTKTLQYGVFPLLANLLLFYLLARLEPAMFQGALFALGSLTVLPIIAGICLVVGCVMLGLLGN